MIWAYIITPHVENTVLAIVRLVCKTIRRNKKMITLYLVWLLYDIVEGKRESNEYYHLR